MEETTTTAAETKVSRKPKALQKFIVGKWLSPPDGDKPAFFQPELQQPEEDLTDVNKMIAWTKSNFGEGQYSFVREIPGRLIIANQTVTKAEFGA